MSLETKASIALVAISALWGSTFVIVKGSIATVPPGEFLVIRFAIASVALALIFPRKLKHMKEGALGGLLAGSLVGVGYITQTVGLAHTTATRSGLITGMFVVIAPLAQALLLRKLPGRRTWVAVALSVAGLFALSGSNLSGANFGDAITVATAIAFGFHIAVLGIYSPRSDPISLGVYQMLVAAMAAIPLAATEDLVVPGSWTIWASLALLGIGASAIAYGGMTWAQRHLSPARTAVTLTLEPVFAVITGWLVLGERLGPTEALGAAAIVIAMLIVSAGAGQQGAYSS